MKNKQIVFFVCVIMMCIGQAFAQTNINIADKAKTYVGQYGWSCKEFVQFVIGQIGGTLGAGYHDCYLDAGFTEVSVLQSGDIIQTSNPTINYEWDDYYIYHSAVYAGISGSYYEVVDSNYSDPQDFKVRDHNWDPYAYVSTKPNHQVYFYRLMVGRNQDGSNCKEFLCCYHTNGDNIKIGCTVANLEVPFTDGRVSVWPNVSNCLFQMFSGGTLGECAILYDTVNSPNQAFVVHNQLWYFIKANTSVLGYLGGPVDQERYATDDYNGHQLAVQKMANGYLVYDTVYGYSDARGTLSAGFHYATIPGNGTSLNLYATAQSPTTVYLSGSAVTGTSYYRVYQDNQYLGTLNPATLDFTVSNLAPSSTPPTISWPLTLYPKHYIFTDDNYYNIILPT
ncbi:MAG: hypothetical protein PHW95_03745 [Patescibacteria group bacterium]|nr:hypothetical protein [Patescibacteria group bacterium]